MTTLAYNKKATFNHELLEHFEAGLVLRGFEAKAVRVGKVNLQGAYVVVRGGEVFLVGAAISPYQEANTPKNYEKDRVRKLLLSRKEITKLDEQSERAGLTIVPIRLYNKGRKIKLEIALARGKKKHDKRETIKERDVKRDIDRLLKNQ